MKARWAHFRTWLSWLLMRRGEACIRVRKDGSMYLKGCKLERDGSMFVGEQRISCMHLPDDSPRTMFVHPTDPAAGGAG